MGQNRLYIGQVAKILGISPKTIRWYESEKLISKSKRDISNYRYYTKEDLETLIFIRKSLSLGFSINEIKAIFAIKSGGGQPCDFVLNLIKQKIVNLQSTIESLKPVLENLENLQSILTKQSTPEKQAKSIICGCIENNCDLEVSKP